MSGVGWQVLHADGVKIAAICFDYGVWLAVSDLMRNFPHAAAGVQLLEFDAVTRLT